MEARRGISGGRARHDGIGSYSRASFDPNDPEASTRKRVRSSDANEQRGGRGGRRGASGTGRPSRDVARGDGPSLPVSATAVTGFFEPLSRAVALEQEAVRLKVPSVDRNNYGPFLLMLNPDKLAVITLHVVIGQLMKGEESFSPESPKPACASSCASSSGWAKPCRRR